MKRSVLYVVLTCLLLSVATIRCSTGASLLKAGSPLISSLSGVPSLSTITSLLQTPGLSDLLGGALKSPFTLLAPTNDALGKLGASALSSLSNPSNVAQVANLLKDHIVPGKLDAASLANSAVNAVSGKALNLGGANLGSLISGEAFNVFPIDKVLGQ